MEYNRIVDFRGTALERHERYIWCQRNMDDNMKLGGITALFMVDKLGTAEDVKFERVTLKICDYNSIEELKLDLVDKILVKMTTLALQGKKIVNGGLWD